MAADKSETLNPANSMEYKNTQNILAAYAEWKGNFGKIGTMLGTRYEQTWEKVKFEQGKGDNFDKNYGNLVPSASLSYSIAPGSEPRCELQHAESPVRESPISTRM